MWSQSRLVNNAYIVVECDFPRDRFVSKKLWAVWKNQQEEIKEDGFRFRKRDDTGLWKIAYWHTITEESHVKDNTTGKPQWRMLMEQKLAKWIAVLEATVIDQDDFSRPKKVVVNIEKPAAAVAKPVTYEESVLDFEMNLDEEGETVSKPIPKPKPPVKPAAAFAIPKAVNKPVRVDVQKLLEAPDEEY